MVWLKRLIVPWIWLKWSRVEWCRMICWQRYFFYLLSHWSFQKYRTQMWMVNIEGNQSAWLQCHIHGCHSVSRHLAYSSDQIMCSVFRPSHSIWYPGSYCGSISGPSNAKVIFWEVGINNWNDSFTVPFWFWQAMSFPLVAVSGWSGAIFGRYGCFWLWFCGKASLERMF